MTILEAIAHQPLTRHELAFLVRMSPDEVADAIWDGLVQSRLAEVDINNRWSATAEGRLLLEAKAAVRRDEARACVGRCG